MVRTALISLLVLAAAVSQAQAQVSKFLDFDADGVLPSDESDIEFVAYTQDAAALEPGVYSQSGGLLTGNSLPSRDYSMSYAYPNKSVTGGGLDEVTPWWIEGRVRLVESNPLDVNSRFCNLTVWTGQHRFTIYYTSTAIRYDRAGNPGYVEIAADVSEFHVLRMEGLGGQFSVFIDGNLIAADQFSVVTPGNGFSFGLSSYYTGGHAEWDYVHFESGENSTAVQNTSWGELKELFAD